MAPWELVDPGGFWLVRLLVKRGVAVTYLLAFLVAARQFRPLAGEDGLLPLDHYRFTTPAERRETGDWWVREKTDTVIHATGGGGAWRGPGYS